MEVKVISPEGKLINLKIPEDNLLKKIFRTGKRFGRHLRDLFLGPIIAIFNITVHVVSTVLHLTVLYELLSWLYRQRALLLYSQISRNIHGFIYDMYDLLKEALLGFLFGSGIFVLFGSWLCVFLFVQGMACEVSNKLQLKGKIAKFILRWP